MTPLPRFEVVSSDHEPLILVDAEDRQVGVLDKASCHEGDGRLHRAFSLFVFNPQGYVLLQKRHGSKKLWPGYWSNACCSHPRAGEPLEAAVVRRAAQELGLVVEPQFLFKFDYKARFEDVGTEHEVCSVFVSHGALEPRINEAEIAAWRWVAPQDLELEITAEDRAFTPWLKIEWQRLRREFQKEIEPSSP